MQAGDETIVTVECLPFFLFDNETQEVDHKLAFLFVENALLVPGARYNDTVFLHVCCGV